MKTDHWIADDFPTAPSSLTLSIIGGGVLLLVGKIGIQQLPPLLMMGKSKCHNLCICRVLENC